MSIISYDTALENEYGAIFCMGVLVYLHSPLLFKNTLRKFYDLLKPGGYLITRDSISKGKTFRHCYRHGYYATYRSQSFFLGSFEKAGFALERSIEMFTRPDKNNSFYVFRKGVEPL